MKCLVETQEPGNKNCVRIMLGSINYCGNLLSSAIEETIIEETDRDVDYIRLRNVCSFAIDYTEVETRFRNVINNLFKHYLLKKKHQRFAPLDNVSKKIKFERLLIGDDHDLAKSAIKD